MGIQAAVGERELDVGVAPRNTDIQLTLADGSLYAHTGKVNFVERAVDATTGTLGVELAFPNPIVCSGPASTAGRGCCSTPIRAPSWFHSELSRNCRASTAWPWSMRAIRLRFAR